MSEKQQKSFFSKKIITCPGCQTEFNREELQTGRGRINAGKLTRELRRLYIPTQKYGIIQPLVYPIVVCPSCYFAGLSSDFQKLAKGQEEKISQEEENRHKIIQNVFGQDLDFTEYRTSLTGLASYILAFACTIHLPKDFAPTIRRGLYALRAAWLTHDIYQKNQSDHFKELEKTLYHQAFINYDIGLEKQIKGVELFDNFVWMGPDVDTNFGYDGLLYILAWLTIKHITTFSPEERVVKIGQTKKVLSKIFGFGKSYKDKPEQLVILSKNLYASASKILKKLEEDGLDISIADEIENQEDDE